MTDDKPRLTKEDRENLIRLGPNCRSCCTFNDIEKYEHDLELVERQRDEARAKVRELEKHSPGQASA